MRSPRIFLLSPANCGGRRAKQAMSPNATFALAAALRSSDGAPLGDFFSFISQLYFRGKLTYARRFAAPPDPANPIVGSGVHVITPNAGLRSPDTLVTHAAIRGFAQGDIDAGNKKYRGPLESSARTLAGEVGPDCDVVGRGDMSRGGLLLRHARDGVELPYVPILGATLHGARPPKLPPLRRSASPS